MNDSNFRYMYPRHLLTYHFWNLQQRVEFQELFLKERTSYNRKIFRLMQSKLESTRNSADFKNFNYGMYVDLKAVWQYFSKSTFFSFGTAREWHASISWRDLVREGNLQWNPLPHRPPVVVSCQVSLQTSWHSQLLLQACSIKRARLCNVPHGSRDQVWGRHS